MMTAGCAYRSRPVERRLVEASLAAEVLVLGGALPTSVFATRGHRFARPTEFTSPDALASLEAGQRRSLAFRPWYDAWRDSRIRQLVASAPEPKP